MASRTVSPGGALLRSSRVFAVPNVLPKPVGTLSSTTNAGSDTQTLPYPIHATITTHQSSRQKGDWGFKRPLPLRSTTKTSTPFIRVKAIDTIEHVTDYGSAADHTVNLYKWQEMNVPISTPTQASMNATSIYSMENPRSVFEDDIDRITPLESEDATDSGATARWKFQGPWVAGMSEGEFNSYLQKTVRKRKLEFRNSLRAACLDEKTKKAHREARDKGQMDSEVTISAVTEAELQEYIVSLRHNRMQLIKHVQKFLDMPPLPQVPIRIDEAFHTMSLQDPGQFSATEQSPYTNSGPPKTHPSAGLSYTRSASYTFNHPLYGPQTTKPPVQARVVLPKSALGSTPPMLGVGGFVTRVPINSPAFNVLPHGSKNKKNSLIDGLAYVEPDLVGGSKAYVQPTAASVDPEGRVVLRVEGADPEAIKVHEGKTEEIPSRPHAPAAGYAKPTDISAQAAFDSLSSQVYKTEAPRQRDPAE